MNQMRKKIFAICYQLGWITTPNDKDDMTINQQVIDMFLLKRGAVKKRLNDCSYDELINLVNQFEQILKKNEEAWHNKKIEKLLSEIKISVQKA
jgi:hypothetical protein